MWGFSMTTIVPTSYYSTRHSRYDKANSTTSGKVYSGISDGRESTTETTGSHQSDEPIDSRPSVAVFKFMGQVITVTNLAVDLKPINISELPEGEYQSFIEGEAARIEVNKQYLERQYMHFPEPPDLSNYPGNKAVRRSPLS